MLLEKLDIVNITPCIAYPEKIKVIASSSVELEDIIPYLAVTLKNKVRGINYNTNMKNLTFTLRQNRYTVHATKVAITTLDDLNQAKDCLEWIQNEINEAYSQKDKISPLTESTKNITPFELFKYTPKTNCGKCGEATCLAFVSKLCKQRIELSLCPTLQEKEYEMKKNKLIKILQESGHEIN